VISKFVFAVVAAAASVAPAFAGADDYAFEPVQAEIEQGDDVTVALRLVHRPTGKPVPDAVVFRTRFDMAPDGMAEMQAPLRPLSHPEPGVYAFKTSVTMEGRWLLSIAAKVQGEPETVVGRITLTASERGTP
jgi:hypothetical protein